MRHDDKEFEAFYRKNYASVYWFFRRAHVADDEAHDLAQEVFTRVWDAWHDYRGEAVRNYLETIARHVLTDRFRRIHAQCRGGDEKPLDDPAIASELIELPVAIEDVLARQRLYEMIDRLPPIPRQCVLLWIDGYRYEEIGRILRLSVEAVKTRLRDAKRLLREDYDDHNK